ncbi:MAG: antibiotic biosynthesis monooxygenase [Gammaproteobacteria bacterium]
MSLIAETPAPPYYAVIFSSLRNADIEGYAETATRMVELAAEQPGFLGVESVREDLGITVSYWSDLQSIKRWKAHAEHRLAQQMGMDKWYSSYKTRIALVERDYGR